MRIGAALTLIGLALVAITVARSDTALFVVLGGSGLNVSIVGAFFVFRPLVGKLRRHLPPWLPW